MTQKQIEKKSLLISTMINFIIAGAGFWTFLKTGIQAMFVDFFFSFIAFTSLIFAIAISAYSNRKTKTYPEGMFFLEPLYAACKSMTVIFLLGMSVWSTSKTAYLYFYEGIGERMNIGPVLPYTGMMVILCFGLGFFNYRQNKKINNVSVILNAESKSNIIDGVQSLGIGIAVLILSGIEINSSLGFLHYTGDFFITLILAVLSIKEPIKILRSSFVELSNGITSDQQIQQQVAKVMKIHFEKTSKMVKYHVYKTGASIKIKIFLSEKLSSEQRQKMLQTRLTILKELHCFYDHVEIIYQF